LRFSAITSKINLYSSGLQRQAGGADLEWRLDHGRGRLRLVGVGYLKWRDRLDLAAADLGQAGDVAGARQKVGGSFARRSRGLALQG